jgi:hypothetical protein
LHCRSHKTKLERSIVFFGQTSNQKAKITYPTNQKEDNNNHPHSNNHTITITIKMIMDRSTMELVYEYHEQLLAATASSCSTPPPEKEIPLTQRRVRFAVHEATVSDLPSPLLLLHNDVDDVDSNGSSSIDSYGALWYTSPELQLLKLEARNIIFRKDQPGSEMDELRGLERYDYERARLKRLTNQHILAAFRESMDNAPFLSLVCQRCTMWARNLALDQGAHDALMAQHLAATTSTFESEDEVFPTMAPVSSRCGSKHTMVEAEEGRRVRPCVMQR